MGYLAEGILGFVQGAATGALSEVKRSEDMEDKRQLMFAEEMKQRRLASFAMDLKNQDQLSRLQTLDANGFFAKPGNEGLRDIAAIGGPESVASVLQNRAQVDYKKTSEADDLVSYGPGQTVGTKEQIQALVAGEPYRTPDRPPSPTSTRTGINELFKLVDTELWKGSSTYTDSQQGKLVGADMTDIQSDEAPRLAYTLLLKDIARAKVVGSVRQELNKSPANLDYYDPQQLVGEIQEEAKNADILFQSVISRFSEALKASNASTLAQRTAAIQDLIDNGFTLQNGERKNPVQTMKDNGYWSPIMANILINTLSARTGS